MTLWDRMDCSQPGSSVHGILQAIILEWVPISSSRGSSQPRDSTRISCIGRQILYHCHLRSPEVYLLDTNHSGCTVHDFPSSCVCVSQLPLAQTWPHSSQPCRPRTLGCPNCHSFPYHSEWFWRWPCHSRQASFVLSLDFSNKLLNTMKKREARVICSPVSPLAYSYRNETDGQPYRSLDDILPFPKSHFSQTKVLIVQSDTNIHMDEQQDVISLRVMITEVMLQWVIKHRVWLSKDWWVQITLARMLVRRGRKRSGNSGCDIVI